MKLKISPNIALPTKYGILNFKLFRSKIPNKEAIIVHHTNTFEDIDTVHVRIHNSCVFSETLGTMDCDCSSQLIDFLKKIESNNGLLLYVYDEGRGAGLMNKIKAINLQQELGINTAQAYEKLNLQLDKEDYLFESEILKAILPNKKIILHTNNPKKVEGLKINDINVINRQPLVKAINETIIKYLLEKANVLDHDIEL